MRCRRCTSRSLRPQFHGCSTRKVVQHAVERLQVLLREIAVERSSLGGYAGKDAPHCLLPDGRDVQEVPSPVCRVRFSYDQPLSCKRVGEPGDVGMIRENGIRELCLTAGGMFRDPKEEEVLLRSQRDVELVQKRCKMLPQQPGRTLDTKGKGIREMADIVVTSGCALMDGRFFHFVGNIILRKYLCQSREVRDPCVVSATIKARQKASGSVAPDRHLRETTVAAG